MDDLKKRKCKKKKTPKKKNSFKKWQAQYRDQRWLDLRESVLERDGYRCNMCGKTDCVFNVHHIRYNPDGDIWDVSMKDLITLCEKCHKHVHNIIKFEGKNQFRRRKKKKGKRNKGYSVVGGKIKVYDSKGKEIR